MEKQTHHTQKDQRVKLKSTGEDSLYAYACAGSEGWVREQQFDNMGYPMVYIEWDKDHWTYNGEPDRWAFDSHFDVVEDGMSEAPNPADFQAFMQDMFENWQKSQGSDGPEPESKPEPSKKDDSKAFASAVEIASGALDKSDSFILITVTREHLDGHDIPTLTPRVLNFYRSPEGGLLAEMQLPKILQMSHEELVIDAIKRHLDEPES